MIVRLHQLGLTKETLVQIIYRKPVLQIIRILSFQQSPFSIQFNHLVGHKDGTYAEGVDYREIIMRNYQVKL